MRVLLIALLFGFSNFAMAKSLDCSISKYYNKDKQKLVQTTFAEEDPEEEVEEYKLVYDKIIVADVINVPYQNGVDLTLSTIDKSIVATANFDLAEDDYLSLDLKFLGTRYSLVCTRN